MNEIPCDCKDPKPGQAIRVTCINNPHCALCGDKIESRETLMENIPMTDGALNAMDGIIDDPSNELSCYWEVIEWLLLEMGKMDQEDMTVMN